MNEVSEEKNPDPTAGQIVFSEELYQAYMSDLLDREDATNDDLKNAMKLHSMHMNSRIEKINERLDAQDAQLDDIPY